MDLNDCDGIRAQFMECVYALLARIPVECLKGQVIPTEDAAPQVKAALVEFPAAGPDSAETEYPDRSESA